MTITAVPTSESPKRMDFGAASGNVACMAIIDSGKQVDVYNERLQDEQVVRARDLVLERLRPTVPTRSCSSRNSTSHIPPSSFLPPRSARRETGGRSFTAVSVRTDRCSGTEHEREDGAASDQPANPGCFGTDRAAGFILAPRAGDNGNQNRAYMAGCGGTP